MVSYSNTSEIAGLRNALVDKLIEMGCIQSQHVEETFRIIPRHLFVPGVDLDKVYSDNSIPTKYIDGKLVSSSSQPAIMAIMLEQLGLQPGHRVLEIGAGTGFNAGLMQHVVGDSGMVVTVDIDKDVVDSTREHLKSAGLDRVCTVCGDGGLGCADHAPYDRITLTVGAWDIVPAWLDQLKPGGRLLLPLEITDGIQKCVAFEKKNDCLESVSVRDCGFMTLRGAFVKPQDSIPISVGPESGLRILVKERVKVDGDEIYRLLSGPSKDHAAGIQVNPNEVFFGGLSLWLSLRDPSLCSLTAEGQSVDQEIMPCFLVIQSIQKLCVTIGLLEDEELCVFVRPPEQDSSVEQPEGYEKFELYVRSYGSGTELAERLIEQTKSWDAAGRPSSNGLRVRVYPRDAEYALSMDGYVIDKEWTRIFMRWE